MEQNKEAKVVKTGKELQEQIVRLMIENERERMHKQLQDEACVAAFIVIALTLGNVASTFITELLEMHYENDNRLVDRIKGKAKQALGTMIKSLKTARGALLELDEIENLFTESQAVDVKGQIAVGEDFIKKYHEIGELCCLYENAVNSNENIMQILRPILLGQTKHEEIVIPQKTINKFILKTPPAK